MKIIKKEMNQMMKKATFEKKEPNLNLRHLADSVSSATCRKLRLDSLIKKAITYLKNYLSE